jgi:hypothetical protein
MRPPGYDRRPRWKDVILRAATLQPTTKLVLLVTLEHMKADGKVYVDRATIARALGLSHPQRVSERWSQACEAGYLTLVHKGSHGRHSTYQALIPEVPSVRVSRSLETPENPVTRETTKCPENAVTTTRDPAQTQPHTAAGVPGTDRNAGSEEEQVYRTRSIGKAGIERRSSDDREERSA